MTSIDTQALLPFARKYIWWMPPGEAVRRPLRVVSQVMNMGTWDDAQSMRASLGDAALRAAITHSAAGEFNARSWTFWHYRLGLSRSGEVPPMPSRRFG